LHGNVSIDELSRSRKPERLGDNIAHSVGDEMNVTAAGRNQICEEIEKTPN
jgi:hypothetical protein